MRADVWPGGGRLVRFGRGRARPGRLRGAPSAWRRTAGSDRARTGGHGLGRFSRRWGGCRASGTPALCCRCRPGRRRGGRGGGTRRNWGRNCGRSWETSCGRGCCRWGERSVGGGLGWRGSRRWRLGAGGEWCCRGVELCVSGAGCRMPGRTFHPGFLRVLLSSVNGDGIWRELLGGAPGRFCTEAFTPWGGPASKGWDGRWVSVRVWGERCRVDLR